MMKTYVSVFVKDSWRQGLRDENVIDFFIVIG